MTSFNFQAYPVECGVSSESQRESMTFQLYQKPFFPWSGPFFASCPTKNEKSLLVLADIK